MSNTPVRIARIERTGRHRAAQGQGEPVHSASRSPARYPGPRPQGVIPLGVRVAVRLAVASASVLVR